MSYFVYILECKDNRFYTGYTTDLNARYEKHVNGTAKCKFTRSFPPIRIAASWQFATKSEAMKAEYAIKQLSKSEKQKRVDDGQLDLVR